MVRHTRTTLTALLLAAGALVLAPVVRAEQYGSTQSGSSQEQMGQSSTGSSQQPQTMGTMGATQAQLPQGINPKDVGNARSEIRDTLNGVVKTALTRDNFKDLADYLVKTDRDRLAVSDNKYNDRLNTAIDQFHQAWKSKFNSDFSFKSDQALSDQYLNVTTGEVTNPQQVDHWPLSPTGKVSRETAKPAMNQGTQVAVANLSGAEGVQPINISFVRDGNDWKLDIPDNISKDQFQENLAKHITELTSMQGQWGNDQNAAQRFIVAHILYGLYGVEKGGQTGATESPSTSTGMEEGKTHHKHQHEGTESQGGSAAPSSSGTTQNPTNTEESPQE